jgi:t-SNARE complex subunit (syntaxin)
MKPTLNEEIGMSFKAENEVINMIPKNINEIEVLIDSDATEFKNDSITKYIEKERIKKQSQKVWGFVFLAIVIIVTYFLNR